MTRLQRYAALAVLVVALVAVGACTLQSWRLRRAQQRADAAEAAEEMTAAGWAAAIAKRHVEAPADVLVPEGAKPVAVVVGSVGFGPRTLSPGPMAVPPGHVLPGPGGETAIAIPGEVEKDSDLWQPWPTPDDLAGGCSTTIVEARDGSWWAKSLWTGRLRLPDGGEVVRPDVELELQRVEVRRAEVAAPAKRFAIGLRRPRFWRTGWSAGVGLAYEPIDGSTRPAAFIGYGISF